MLHRLFRPSTSSRVESRALARRRTQRMRPRLDHLEARIQLSAPESNNIFDLAYTPPDNPYLERNYVNTDSVSVTSDDNDFYKFYNMFGGSHLYASLLGLSSDADLYVYDQNRNLLASSLLGGNASETINVDLPANQYFYVRVAAYSGNTNYSLFLYNDFSGSSLATARDIGTSWGQGSDKFWDTGRIASQDYLDYRDNVDVVKFTMESAGTVSLRMKDFDYTGGLVASMQLLDKDGNVLSGTSGTVGDGLNIDRFSLAAGTYYVRYTQLSGSDPYTFRITSDYAGDTTATARQLGDLTNRSREFFDMVGGPFGLPTYEDSKDLYKFSLSQTAPVDLRLHIAQGLAPPTFDATLQLARDTNGNGFIDSNEIILQSANQGDDSLSTTLAAGTYYVVVVPSGFYTSYQLDLDSDLDANVGVNNMAGAIDLGTVLGEAPYLYGGFGISPGDATDYYKVTLPNPGTISLFAGNNGVAAPLSRSQFTPVIQIIRDANGNRINDAGETVASASGQLSTALPAGVYYIRLVGDGQQIDYYAHLAIDYAGNTLGTARPLAAIDVLNPPTQTFRDYIEAYGPTSDVNDFYRFDLAAPYTATLTTTGVAGEDLSLSLIQDANNNGVVDPGDVLITSDAPGSPSESIVRSLIPGRYFVRVMGRNGSTNYTLTSNFVGNDSDDTIAEVQNRPSTNIRAFGQYADLSLTTRDDVDLVQFNAVAGQRASFNVDPRDGAALDTYLRLFKADGTPLAANDDGGPSGEAAGKFSYLEYTFAQSGTYYIGISLSPNKSYSATNGTGDVAGAGATGSYRVYLNSLGTTSPTVLRVNAGGPNFITAGGKFYEADGGFSGGTTANSAGPIDNTTDDALFASNRSGTGFSYSHAVANGTYSLSLLFAEDTFTAVGQRKLNVFAEGQTILSNFDIVQAAGGARKAIVQTITVVVIDGRIDIHFAGVLGKALVSGISLVKA